jgi:hypothetical protein
MNTIFSRFVILVTVAGVFFLISCKDRKRNDKAIAELGKKAGKIRHSKDTLPDTPEFFISFDNKEYTVEADNVNAYLGTDSTITLFAKTGDTSGLQLVIPLKAQVPFSVPTGYSSKNTKIAFSEEQAVLPTVILSNYPLVDVSFNNLDDGYHQKDLKADAITVTGYRVLEGDNLHGWTHQVKGYIHTTVLKNVYSGKDKEYNHDYEIEGRFVVRFKVH